MSSPIDVNESVAAAKAAVRAGEATIALEILERARREILGDVWVGIDDRAFHECSEADQADILRFVDRVLQGGTGDSGPRDAVLRVAIAGARLRALVSATDQLGIELLRAQMPGGVPIRRFSVYDAVTEEGMQEGWLRLFDRAVHVDRRFSNVQVPGRLTPYDVPAVITRLRVSKPADATASLSVNDAIHADVRVDDVAERPFDLLVLVPSRSIVRLQLDFYEPLPNPTYFYLEGWTVNV